MKNLDKYKNRHGKIWLNIASSSKILEDFVNFDNHIALNLLGVYPITKWIIPKKYRLFFEEYGEAKKKGMIIRRNCKKALFFSDNSIDHILCSHFLEHVYPAEMEIIIKDFYRVLKNNATVHIIVPDIEFIVGRYLENKKMKDPQAADDLIQRTLLSTEQRGSIKYRLLEMYGGFGLQHRWMYDHASMVMRVKDAGFEILDTNETPSKAHYHDDCSLHVVACKR